MPSEPLALGKSYSIMEPSKRFRRFVMELDKIRLGKRIKAARKRRGLSQLALSETLDCTPNHLSYIENGNRSLSLAKFVQLANALGASADELLMDSLDNTTEAMDHKYSSIMAGCSECEKRMLLSIIFAVKEVMEGSQL